jgi:hypothetical protein
MFKKIPYRITGIELGEHAHHMNPSFFLSILFVNIIIDSLLVLHIVMHAFYVLLYCNKL